jgi:hypothetical protein
MIIEKIIVFWENYELNGVSTNLAYLINLKKLKN